MRGFTTLIAAALFCAASLNAQGLGALSGSVTDPSGAAIPGAKVTVTEPATEFSRSVTTNEDGLYSIPSLRPAVYRLTVEAQGFRLFTESGRELLADQSATVNVKLEVGAVSEAVEVAASAAQVDTTTSTIKQVVDQRQIVELPLNGRNAAALTFIGAGSGKFALGRRGSGADENLPRRGYRFDQWLPAIPD
jgi:carboxypeptidase family protein